MGHRTGSRPSIQRPIGLASGARVAPRTARDVRTAACTDTERRSANPRTAHSPLRTQNPDTTRMRRTMLDYERVTAPLSLRTRSGEPLLLLHGLGTSRRDFTAVIAALTDRFDVINVDLPGIGRSPHLEQRPTVAAITD